MLLLHRSILWELCRTTLLTAGVLVTVIAFGAAIPPLTRNLLGPRELGVFVLFACVPMLQYALPFAAAFATTTVYLRLSADREVQAMAAAGWSLGRILRPVAMLGAVLLIAMMALVHFVAPVFWASMQGLLGRDAARLLVTSVEQGRALRVGSVEIYADEAYLSPDPPPSGARDRLYLVGVAAIELDRRGATPTTEFTAEHAVVDIHEGETGAILKMALVNATLQRAGDSAVAVLPQAMPEAIDLGGRGSTGAKGMTLPQLLAARRSPGEVPQIRDAAAPLRRALEVDQAWGRLGARFEADGAVAFDALPEGTVIRIEGAVLREGRLLPAGLQPIRAFELRGGKVVREAEPPEFSLRFERLGGGEWFELHAAAGTPAIERGGPRPLAGRWPQRIAGLRLEGVAPPEADDLSAAELIAAGRAIAGSEERDGGAAPRSASAEAGAAAGRLEAAVERLGLDLTARQNQRMAQSLAGLLMPLLAGVLAVRSRSSAVLLVFLLVFLPSLGAMLCISSGEQMIRWDRPQGGLGLMWGAEAALAAAVVVGWWRASKN